MDVGIGLHGESRADPVLQDPRVDKLIIKTSHGPGPFALKLYPEQGHSHLVLISLKLSRQNVDSTRKRALKL
jgi:hypothetical protein